MTGKNKGKSFQQIKITCFICILLCFFLLRQRKTRFHSKRMRYSSQPWVKLIQLCFYYCYCLWHYFCIGCDIDNLWSNCSVLSLLYTLIFIINQILTTKMLKNPKKSKKSMFQEFPYTYELTKTRAIHWQRM